MLRIGAFARLGQVSVKTLRLYDELGLLRPQHVESPSGYRYYTLDQLATLHRVLAFKDLGFSLDQIGCLLAANLGLQEVRRMLCGRKAELCKRLDREQEQLLRVEARLAALEGDETLVCGEVVIKRIEPLLCASLWHDIECWEDCYRGIRAAIDDLRAQVQKARGTIAGPLIELIHEPRHAWASGSVELALPLEAPISGDACIQVAISPGYEAAASALHQGDFAVLHHTHTAVLSWAGAAGYRQAGPARNVFLRCTSDGNPFTNITEVQIPVEREAT